MLMADQQLAEIQTEINLDTLEMNIRKNNELLLKLNLGDQSGQIALENFIQNLIPSLNESPSFIQSVDGHFMDKPGNLISLINLETLRMIEKKWDINIDPLRFRANIYIDNAEPWSEFNWVGKDIFVGSGVFYVDSRNGRCGATNVNPKNGRRDLNIPGSLRRTFGHKDLGVYLVAKSNACLAIGDYVNVPDMPIIETAQQSFQEPSLNSFICKGCYFIYDEKIGCSISGIKPGTKFGEIQKSWLCPDCGANKLSFEKFHLN
jgi:GntR family transcriptional regulator/MocR family aminotransferase